VINKSHLSSLSIYLTQSQVIFKIVHACVPFGISIVLFQITGIETSFFVPSTASTTSTSIS
jgi:hypothetical protein